MWRFPGSDILSTVSTEAAGAFFAPSVSLAAGKDLAYANDFSDFSMEGGTLRRHRAELRRVAPHPARWQKRLTSHQWKTPATASRGSR